MHRRDDLPMIARDDAGGKILFEEAKHKGPVTKHIFLKEVLTEKILLNTVPVF